MKLRDNFVAFILTHGRPDKVWTYDTLRNNGYTGPIILVVDNEDNTVSEYIRIYDLKSKTTVHVFDKENRLFYDLERIWRDGKYIDVDNNQKKYIEYIAEITRQLDSINKEDQDSLKRIYLLITHRYYFPL